MDFTKSNSWLICIIALMVMSSPYRLLAGEADGYPYTGEIIGKDTNLRAGSNLNYKIVTKLQKGDLVYVTAERREWLRVRCPEGTLVWVGAKYINENRIAATKLNIRSGPGLEHIVISSLIEGDEVTVVAKSRDGEWVSIKPPDNAYLWVHKDLVNKKGGPEAYNKHLSRKAEVKRRMGKAELTRELNMKKDPVEVPFDDLITEYESIASEYSEFTEEATLAASRAEELTTMKDRLEEKIAARKQDLERKSEQEQFEPRYVTAKGILHSSEGKAHKQGIMKLKSGGKLVCVVESKVIDLKQYKKKQVQIWGMQEYSSSWEVPLINVKRIKLVK